MNSGIKLSEIWPNFFIVGAPKAGTTSLYEYLNQVSEIYMSPVKEPRFFAPVITKYFHAKQMNEKEYLKLFENIKNEIAIGEASVAYLRDPEAPKLIHNKIPNAKIIIILRDPIERAYSHYLADLRRGSVRISFLDAIDTKIELDDEQKLNRHIILEPGFYAEQVKRYLDTFGPNQVKIIIFEEFIKDPKKTFEEVLEFLGIEKTIVNTGKKFNVYGRPRNKISELILGNKTVRKFAKSLLPKNMNLFVIENILNKKTKKPQMGEKENQILSELYYENIIKLEKIINRKLPWFL